ncbi:hypothetical protein L596_013590 [Steinernema carpocapsae]|uniref:MITD1 C-terminal phospholipase D-like domain-containing protein n=1 Tax=Steinernema carpocapsae TaxID=34508 RepID=A0A4U5P1H4_STECR|nr:hypothetical protein L596_013590 [Steinernema carpocapsae]
MKRLLPVMKTVKRLSPTNQAPPSVSTLSSSSGSSRSISTYSNASTSSYTGTTSGDLSSGSGLNRSLSAGSYGSRSLSQGSSYSTSGVSDYSRSVSRERNPGSQNRNRSRSNQRRNRNRSRGRAKERSPNCNKSRSQSVAGRQYGLQDAQEMQNLAETLLEDAKKHEMKLNKDNNADKSVFGDLLLRAAVKFYQGSILLQEASKVTENEKAAQEAKTHSTHTEKLQEKFAKSVERTIKVAEDSTGHDFAGIFGGCFDERLTSVVVEDAYIIRPHQVQLFVDFCELVTSKAKNLKLLILVTRPQAKLENFDHLKASLAKKRITLVISRRESIHDREIVFDNGWIVKIGRGLDIFKKSPHLQQALQPCKETTIEVIKLTVK